MTRFDHRRGDWSAKPIARASFSRGLAWAAPPLLGLAGALVFWVFDALPFQDLPAHAGLIALRHRLARSPFEQRFFVFSPHLGPYSLFRGLGEALLPLLGPVGAVRALATLPVLATPLALLWARRRLHADRTTTPAYFGLALSFGFMTLLGFASFLLGLAVLVVTLTTWLELLDAVDRGARGVRAALLEVGAACLAPLVFVAHGDAFAIFLVLAGVSAVSTGRRWARLMRLRALAPAIGLAAWAGWSQRTSVVPAGSVPVPGAGLALHFQGVVDKLSLLVTPTLMTRTGIDVLVGLGLWAVLLLGLASTARWARSARRFEAGPAPLAHARALFACLAALSAAFLALPHSVGWFGFADGRLVTLLLLVMVMTVRREALGPRLARAFDRAAPVAACAMIAIALASSFLFQREARGWREVLAGVPTGARLLNLPIEPNSAILTGHPFVHYDKLALADRPVVVSDLWFHEGSAVYPTAQNPSLRLPESYSESDLRVIDWPAYRLDDWDYVLIRTRPDSSQPATPASLALADHRGGWWLFRSTLTHAGALPSAR
jgi:hypothetical protein